MENSFLDYVALHSVLQILEPTTPKVAVMYDPILGKLTYHDVELIGLSDVGEEESPLLVPCYMCSNSLGLFWIPDLQPTFIEYIKPGSEVDIKTARDKIEEIEKWWNTAETDLEPVRVEKKDNISYIKRKGKKDDEE